MSAQKPIILTCWRMSSFLWNQVRGVGTVSEIEWEKEMNTSFFICCSVF